MKKSHITHYFVLLVSLVFLSAISFETQASKITGKIVDENGNPVEDIVVSIMSYKGKLLHGRRHMRMNEQIFPPLQPSNTDATGAFTIENITSPSINLLNLSLGGEEDYEIRSIEIQGIRFNVHRHQFHWLDGFPFGIEEETDEIKVKFTVRLRMRIRGQVLAADGTPLSNANVNLMVKSRSINGSGRGSSGGTQTLDEKGGFTRYVDSPAHYTISVTYQGQTVESKEILLEQGQRMDGLTLTFDEKIQPQKPNIQKQPAHIPPDPERMQAVFKRQREGVWAINPANRHAYRKIQCQSPEDAIAIAKTQNAHLIAINDKEEQEWILAVFGKENYWIGFTAEEELENKKWDNGDPFTYTNWDSNNLISDTDRSTENEENIDKLYTVLIGVTGKWQRIRTENPVAGLTEQAILEKKDLIIGLPLPEEDSE